MKAIYVAGAWGSGTTAMAGALHQLGLTLDAPTFATNDPETPNSLELVEFRSIVLKYVDEEHLKRPFAMEQLSSQLKRLAIDMDNEKYWHWPKDRPRRVLLKLPVAAICLRQMARAFDLSVVTMQRPLAEIEACRQRRGWNSSFGKAGAKIIYGHLYACLAELNLSHISIAYHDLVDRPHETLLKVMHFLDLTELKGSLGNAVRTIRAR